MEAKPNFYWTKERVFEEARKYKTKTEFFKGCGSAYNVARKNGWFDEMTWFVDGYKKDRKWTTEKLFKEARKYKTITEFSKKSPGAYNNALKKGLIDKMVWFKKQHKPNGFWTKEKTFEESKKYKTRGEFSKKSPRAYEVARQNGWLKEITWLIDGRLLNETKREHCVYKYFWKETNSIYVGRTNRKKERHNEHKTKERDTVLKYAKENGFEIPQMEIIENNLTLQESVDREEYWVNYYKQNGYTILNKAKTGSIGAFGFGKLSNEKIFVIAKEYKTKSEFKKGNSSAYYAAQKRDLLYKMDWFENGYVIEMQRRFPKHKSAS